MSPAAGAGFSAAVDAAAKEAGDVSVLPEPRGPLRRLCGDLVRRVRLLSPLFDELRSAGSGEGEAERALVALREGLAAAKELLGAVREGSKIYQAMKGDMIAVKFMEVNGQIEKALDDLHYKKLELPEEVREQIELVHSQFRRAASSVESPDPQLVSDLASVLSERSCDSATLNRISQKLQLTTKAETKRESVALHEMVITCSGELDDIGVDKMSFLLKKLADCAVTDTPTADASSNKSSSLKLRSPIIPDEFRCPISLELMQDPVIVATGQTYERAQIQKLFDSGRKICPKTQQVLTNTTLTPNFVLKSLIAQWCEANGIEAPTGKANQRDKKPGKSSDYDRDGINLLIRRLGSVDPDEQCAAAGEIRLLAKRNVNNRICIAEAGAIPLLVELLLSPDQRTQEHAVTALLNLSINENNKSTIVHSFAIPKIIEVLKYGNAEAQENAAATLFSLSVISENKVIIGEAGAIPPLIELLCHGSPRGKKDAATAIFNLCIYNGNKARAVQAGLATHLMEFLEDPIGGMADDALALLALISGIPEGKDSLLQLDAIPVLVDMLKAGVPRNKENAAQVLWDLCHNNEGQMKAAADLGAEEGLKLLLETGNDRVKRKVVGLLDDIYKIEVSKREAAATGGDDDVPQI